MLGATGYTGRLCAAEAVERGLAVRLAGRRREALDALAAQLRPRAQAAVETAVAEVTDRRSLSALAAGADVLLTTVGPYARLGRPVAEAALAARCPYVDVSGEVGFLAWAYGLGPRAEAAGVGLCPGAGFDGVPGEALAVLATRALGAAPWWVRVAYRVSGARASGGTVRSALGVVGEGGRALLRGRVVPEPALGDRWEVPLPDGPAAALSVPLPEVVTVGRSTGTPNARAYAVLPAAGALERVAGPAAGVVGVLARTPLPRLAESLAARVPGLRGGPDPATRARARATVLVEAEAAPPAPGERGRAVRAVAEVPDPYGATARAAVTVAARLAGDDSPGPGVWTPSQAAGDPAALLDVVGATWRLLDA